MKIIRTVIAGFDRLIDSLVYLACGLLVFALTAVSVEIIFRYFLNRPSIWVAEITEYILLYITFLGTAWLLRREGHVKIDLLLSRLKPKTQAWFNIIISVIGAIMCLLLVWYSARETLVFFQRGVLTPTVLALPKAPIILIIPIGSFLLFIQFLRRAQGYWRGLAPRERMEISL